MGGVWTIRVFLGFGDFFNLTRPLRAIGFHLILLIRLHLKLTLPTQLSTANQSEIQLTLKTGPPITHYLKMA